MYVEKMLILNFVNSGKYVCLKNTVFFLVAS